MSDEDKRVLIATAMLTLAVESIKVVFNYIDRSLAYRQGRKEEERRRATKRGRTHESEGESYVT